VEQRDARRPDSQAQSLHTVARPCRILTGFLGVKAQPKQ
jgi:hypothetical protein